MWRKRFICIVVHLAFLLEISLTERKDGSMFEVHSSHQNKWTIVNIKCLNESEDDLNDDKVKRSVTSAFSASRNEASSTGLRESAKSSAKGESKNLTEYDILQLHNSNDKDILRPKTKRKNAAFDEKHSPTDEKLDFPNGATTDKHILPLLQAGYNELHVQIENHIIPGSENTRIDINCRSIRLGSNFYNRHIRHLTLNSSGTIEATSDWLSNFTNLSSLKVLANGGLILPKNCSWIPRTITSIDLSHTPLDDTYFSDCRTSLKLLTVSGTSLQSLYICLPTLEYLDASWNSLVGGGLILKCDGGGNNLKELKKTHNQLTSWSSCRWPSLTHLHLENNKIQNIDLVSCPPNHLLSLNLANNRLQEPPLKYPPKLETINLSHNRLKKTTPFNHIMQEVDLSYNSLTSLGKGTFRSSWQLLLLNLAHNKLSIIYGHDFSGLNELRHLDISHNSLQHIRHEAFHPLKRIQIIKLNNNALHTLDVRLLSYLPRNLHFDAYNNPWKCSCHLLATLNRISKEYCAPRCSSTPTINCIEGHVEVSSQTVLRQCIEAVQNISEPETSIHLSHDAASDEDTSEERTVTIKYKTVAIPGAAVMVGIMFAMVGARQAYRKRHNIKRYCKCLYCHKPDADEVPTSNGRITEHKPDSDSDSETEF